MDEDERVFTTARRQAGQAEAKTPKHARMELRRFQTNQGEIWLRGEARAFDGDLPILLALAPEFATEGHAFFKLQPYFPEAAVLVGHVPGHHCPPLRRTTVEAFGAAYAEVVAGLNRPTIVLAESVGALAALAMRGTCIRGQALLEPPLRTAKLWPLIDPYRRHLSSAAYRGLISAVFGYFETHIEDRDYRYLLGELAIPTQVLWGDVPLGAPRRVESSPSFVDEAERAALRIHPWIRTVLVRGAGHRLMGVAARTIVEACKDLLTNFAAASPDVLGERPGLQADGHALVRRTPLTARRVLYIGDAFAAFETGLKARHPSVELQIATVDSVPRGAGAFDCIVVAGLQTEAVPRLAALLEDEGDLIATVPSMASETADAMRAALAAAGLQLMAVHDPKLDDTLNDVRGEPSFEAGGVSAPLVVAARRTRSPPPRIVVQVAAYAPFRMDIRTRLPLEGLRSRPDVAVALCGVPAMPLPAAADRPKVLILQRPSPVGFELWKREMAQAIRQGWVTVMEFDDHPDLTAPFGEADWRPFGFTHGVQTSTPPLELAFRSWNPEVRVFPNAVFDLAPFPDRGPSRRLFYGALRRGPFAMEIAASMGRVVAAFPDVEFVVVGDREIFDALPGARKEFHELQTYARYLEIMSSCAISLSPIEDAPLYDTKSDGKFLDASSRGLLTIGSPTVYDRTIRHGETGLIARRAEDWAPLVIEALQDEDARHRMAKAAWSYVRDERMFAHQLPERLDWYRSLWERRGDLTAALVARMPSLATDLQM